MTRCKAANSAKTGNTLRIPPAAWRIVGDAQRGRDRRMKRIDEMAEIDGTAQRRMKVAETISTLDPRPASATAWKSPQAATPRAASARATLRDRRDRQKAARGAQGRRRSSGCQAVAAACCVATAAMRALRIGHEDNDVLAQPMVATEHQHGPAAPRSRTDPRSHRTG